MTKDEQTQLNDELLRACNSGDLNKIKKLIMQGAEVHAEAYCTRTHLSPISTAIYYNHLPVVMFLLENAGVKITETVMGGQTIFQYALNRNKFDIVSYLFFNYNELMPVISLFKYSELIKEKMGRETEAQSLFDYVLQNKSKYTVADLHYFKKRYIQLKMNEDDTKNLKSLVKFL